MIWWPCRRDLEIKLDPFESHQVLMDLKLTLDEGVMAFPIKHFRAASKMKIEL